MPDSFWEEDDYGFTATSPADLMRAIGSTIYMAGLIRITKAIEITEQDGQHTARWRAATLQTIPKAERIKAIAEILSEDD